MPSGRGSASSSHFLFSSIVLRFTGGLIMDRTSGGKGFVFPGWFEVEILLAGDVFRG